ncbi:NAD(P)-dependent oxidoreductase [Blochmannia endosymbiont of Camponotus (Colobopsis) obliquus]|nr:NAD(P)-dependent oxidoreductase [Blochmannia endosymbiont of Camponotus (Colobopsis) obliquus]
MINNELLSALLSNRILINTCRGGVVNNNILLQA